MIRFKSQLHFLHVLKDDKPQARLVLLASANDDFIKAIVECVINTLNWNHKLTKDEKSKLYKYKSRFRALQNTKVGFKSKRKLLIQKGGFIVPLLTTILSGVIGTVTNNSSLERHCS